LPDSVCVATQPTEPLYARVMGDAWLQLAEPVRRLHSMVSPAYARGCLRVEHGRHSLTRFIARRLRLPSPGAAITTELHVCVLGGGERWERAFGGRRFETWQYVSSRTELGERYGPFDFRFSLEADGGSLLCVHREVALRFPAGRLRLPAHLAPRVEAREDAAGPRHIRVCVTVALPGVGLLLAYDGVVEVAEARG
jgi:hypothetical protein